MGVRCGRRRRQRCALMKAKQRVPALRGGQPDDLASNRGSCDRISLRCASMRRKITLNNPAIWGMSVKNNQARRTIMKKTIISAVVFASMFVVGAAPNAQARQCSNASLEGAYGFLDVHTLVPAGTPFVGLGRWNFDGKGNFTNTL